VIRRQSISLVYHLAGSDPPLIVIRTTKMRSERELTWPTLVLSKRVLVLDASLIKPLA
jgi:hypothetical protein